MDIEDYSFNVVATAVYRIILYAAIAGIVTFFVDGDKSEVYLSIFCFLMAVTVLIWFIDTSIQILIYLLSRKHDVWEIKKGIKGDLFVKPQLSNDPDEWLQANLDVFTNYNLDGWFENSDTTIAEFKERFLSPYQSLVFVIAFRSALKQQNFLSWLFHSRRFRKALKEKYLEDGEN